MDRVLAEIAKGEWFVSMECLFKGFDYALKGRDGSTRVVARNEQTAFLTKHLRAYGGTGKYGEYRSAACCGTSCSPARAWSEPGQPRVRHPARHPNRSARRRSVTDFRVFPGAGPGVFTRDRRADSEHNPQRGITPWQSKSKPAEAARRPQGRERAAQGQPERGRRQGAQGQGRGRRAGEGRRPTSPQGRPRGLTKAQSGPRPPRPRSPRRRPS
jgi:hypothetical protein